MYRIAGIALALASAALVGAAQTPTAVPSVWIAGETDAPVFCLILSPGGAARFAGGFRWLNPMSWQYDSAGKQLRITITRLRPADISALQVPSFDSVTKTVVYSLQSDSTLTFGGYLLTLPSALDSATYAIAQRRCRLPRRP